VSLTVPQMSCRAKPGQIDLGVRSWSLACCLECRGYTRVADPNEEAIIRELERGRLCIRRNRHVGHGKRFRPLIGTRGEDRRERFEKLDVVRPRWSTRFRELSGFKKCPDCRCHGYQGECRGGGELPSREKIQWSYHKHPQDPSKHPYDDSRDCVEKGRFA